MAVVELPELMPHANYMYHFCSLYWVWSVYQGAILTNFAIVCNVTLKFKLLCIHLDVTIFVGSPFRLPWIFHWRRHRIHHGHLVKVTSISSHSMRDSHCWRGCRVSLPTYRVECYHGLDTWSWYSFWAVQHSSSIDRPQKKAVSFTESNLQVQANTCQSCICFHDLTWTTQPKTLRIASTVHPMC